MAWQEHCPVGDLLGPGKESQHLEYKSTLRVRRETGEVYKPLERVVVKTVAGYLNSRDGGTLLIGVSDDSSVTGLTGDYATLHKNGKDDRDLFQLHLGEVLRAAMGDAAAADVTAYLHTVDGADVCRVHARPSAVPVEARVVVDRKGQLVKRTAFFVRVGNATREFDPDQKARYVLSRWPAR